MYWNLPDPGLGWRMLCIKWLDILRSQYSFQGILYCRWIRGQHQRRSGFDWVGYLSRHWCRNAVAGYDAVNVTLNPEKKQKILNGNLVQFNCPSCGYQAEFLYPMLYHDQDKKFMVWITFTNPQVFKSCILRTIRYKMGRALNRKWQGDT